MAETVDRAAGLRITLDRGGVVRGLQHVPSARIASAAVPQLAALDHLRQLGWRYAIQASELGNAWLPPSEKPTAHKREYRFLLERKVFDSTVVIFQQTVHGLPVFGGGVAVHLLGDPLRVTGSRASVSTGLSAERPAAADLKRAARFGATELARIFPARRGRKRIATKVLRRRLVVLPYDPSRRILPGTDSVESDFYLREGVRLPPVPSSLVAGRGYVCTELLFERTPAVGGSKLAWLALLDVATAAPLFLHPFVGHATGLVFTADPLTLTGDPAQVPSAGNAMLNPLRSSVTLEGLDIPLPGQKQKLSGEYVKVVDFEAPDVAPPAVGTGEAFDYEARTNHFAAVSAYHHCDGFFRLLESLGFKPKEFFTGTSFPIKVDHRGHFLVANGIEQNASADGNGSGGIESIDFQLADVQNTATPLGSAVDRRLALHELGGHGLLFAKVNLGSFYFAHSAGDSFAAIVSDPGSKAPDRGLTFPWLGWDRRHDRDPQQGWTFGSAKDNNGYGSEQLLSTCHFRIYRSIGGDASELATRTFAARYLAYLLTRAIGTLTPATSPLDAESWEHLLELEEKGTWEAEDVFGGAYGKVIRWAFEKQGLAFLAAGDAADVDLYIDDGRNGEYDYVKNFWSNGNIWNRRQADGGTTHEDPVVGVDNFAYVKIRNRGSALATGVQVRGFHCRPAEGLLWPDDWQAMATPSVAAPDVPANDAQEIVAGPLRWVPSEADDECMLMIVSSADDPSNVDGLANAASIPHWRLVPNDNNIGQRNITPVQASAESGLESGFGTRRFIATNPMPWRARMALAPVFPEDQVGRYCISFRHAGDFFLGPGQSREIRLELRRVGAGPERPPPWRMPIDIELRADGIVVGGIRYLCVIE